MSKCKNCVNLRYNWCEKVSDSPDENMERECVHFRHTTNADSIRSMTDEELAEFLIDLADDGNLRIREWLQQPAGEEDKHETN